jgi:transcription initiation factor TFIIH subunit 1
MTSDATMATTKKTKVKSAVSSGASEVDPFAVFVHEAGSKADFARVPGEALLFSAQTQLKLKGNKVSAGTMHVSTTRVVWCAAGSVTPSMSFPFASISNHQYSPPDMPQVLVKLITASGTFVFVFSSPTTAQTDRNSFRELLSQVKKPVKAAAAAAAAAAASTAAATSVKSESTNGAAIKPEPTNAAVPILPDSAVDTDDDNKTKILPARAPMHGIHITEARRRADLLAADTQVKLLHAELVLSGIVSEEDFWQMRQDDLRMAADRPRAQQRGVRSALIADVEPVERNAEKEHYRLTPSVIRAIFEAAPPVQRAFQQLVPDRLSEQEFWAKYLAARHFHRAQVQSGRAAAARTNETAEDALLARAIEEAERVAVTQSLATVAAATTSSTLATRRRRGAPRSRRWPKRRRRDPTCRSTSTWRPTTPAV